LSANIPSNLAAVFMNNSAYNLEKLNKIKENEKRA